MTEENKIPLQENDKNQQSMNLPNIFRPIEQLDHTLNNSKQLYKDNSQSSSDILEDHTADISQTQNFGLQGLSKPILSQKQTFTPEEEVNQLRKFMKRANELNLGNLKKLQQEKHVKQFPKYGRSSGSLYKLIHDYSIQNIEDTPRERQIKKVYLSKSPKDKKLLIKRNKYMTFRQTEIKHKVTQQVQTQNSFHQESKRNIQNQGKVKVNSMPKGKGRLSAIPQDYDEENKLPSKKTATRHFKHNTISITGNERYKKKQNDQDRTSLYLESISRKTYNFNTEVRRYSKNYSTIQKQYQQTVFNPQSNVFSQTGYGSSNTYEERQQQQFSRTQFQLGIPIQPLKNSQFPDIEERAATTGEAHNNLPKKKQPKIKVLKQSQPKQIKEKKGGFLSYLFGFGKDTEKDEESESVFAERGSHTKYSQRSQMPHPYYKSPSIDKQSFINNLGKKSTHMQENYNNIQGQPESVSRLKPDHFSQKFQQFHVIEPQGRTKQNKKIHPIKNTFEENDLGWIKSQYRPNSQLLQETQMLNFEIKKYKNGVYFGQTNKDGIKHGKGAIFYYNGKVYEGNFVNDLKEGKGYEASPDGSIYKGQFKNGFKEGKGTFQWNNGQVYEGQWLYGKRTGSGMWKSPTNQSYIGEWNNGQVQGFGVYTMMNGDRYEGEFVNSQRHGIGTQRYHNGDIYVGNFRKNRPNGEGQYYWATGQYYRGSFMNGLRHGQGMLKFDDNQSIYRGDFRNDKMCGYGELKKTQQDNYNGLSEKDEQFYVGNFQNDLRHGYGEFFRNGLTKFKGYWINGDMVDDSGTPIIEQEQQRQQTMPNSIVQKSKASTNKKTKKTVPLLKAKFNNKPLSRHNHIKQFSARPQIKLAHSNPPRVVRSIQGKKNQEAQDEEYTRPCGCTKKH